MLEIIKDQANTPAEAELPAGHGRPELSRRGFITAYPMFRYWHKDAVDEGLRTRPLNIYIHTPYCIQRCAYCYFKTTTLKDNRLQEIDAYIAAVCQELEQHSRRFDLKDRPVETVYFGGGTPTLMTEDNIDKLFQTIRDNYTLVDPQINFEGEPVTLTERKAKALQRNGVNRISLGIQSFKEEIVFQTGRQDTEVQAFKAIELAKSIGAEVNIDLISGLAAETMETWAYSVQRAIESQAHNVTIYKLELYANTPYYSAERNEQIHLPTDEQELEMIKYAYEELRKAGYAPINTFTFSRDGGKYDQKHTRSNWLGNDCLSAGVSAFGVLGTRAYQNTNDIKSYIATIEKGEIAAFRGYNLSTFDLMLRDVVMGIKLIKLSHVRFQEKHGLDLLKVCEDEVTHLEDQGFITVDEENITLTDTGLLYGDYVGRCLESKLKDWGTEAGTRARVRF